MYCFPPFVAHCTCFAWRGETGTLLGRNSDSLAVLAARPYAREEALALLAGCRGFLCQYDRASGADTLWSVLYDLGARQILRAEGNPSRTPFEADPWLWGRV